MGVDEEGRRARGIGSARWRLKATICDLREVPRSGEEGRQGRARADASASRKERDTRGGSGALRRPEIRVTGQDGGGFRAGSGRTLRRTEPSRTEVSRIVVREPRPSNAHMYIYMLAADRALSRVIDFVGGSPLPTREPPQLSQGHRRESRERAASRGSSFPLPHEPILN